MPTQNVTRYRRPLFGKPPIGSVVDWSYPLSWGLKHAFLLNEGGGRVTDLLPNNGQTGLLGPGATWALGQLGGQVKSTGADGADIAFGSDGLTTGANGNISVYAVCFVNSIANSPALGHIGSSTADSYHWMLTQSPGDGHVNWTLAGIVAIDSGIIVTVGHTYGIGFSYTRGVSVLFSVHDMGTGSTTIATVSNASTPTVNAGNSTLMSTNSATGTSLNGGLYLTYIWGRALLDPEFQLLHENPYAMIYSPAQRLRSLDRAAGAVTTLPIFVQC